MSDYLLNEIIQYTKDKRSTNYWKRAISLLGEGIVTQELHELKHRMREVAREKDISKPAAYLTSLLEKQIAIRCPKHIKQQKDPIEKIDTYFEESQAALFSNLKPIKFEGQSECCTMILPYGKNSMPWLTLIGPVFFTLSTNKSKSDVVNIIIRTHNEKEVIIPMTRGRIKPRGKERGILTATHGRIFAAVTQFWIEQGCKYSEFKNGAVACYCYVSLRQLARCLGWKKFAGSSLLWLTDMVFDLKTRPYYMDLEQLNIPKLTGYGFTLVDTVEFVEGKGEKGQTESVFKVQFSSTISNQLLFRRAVSRAKDIPQITSEIAFLLRIYLEPKVIFLKGEEYKKKLRDLIDEIALPAANWHKISSQRKRQFEFAVKHIKEFKTADGKTIVVKISKRLFDWLLVAKLENTLC